MVWFVKGVLNGRVKSVLCPAVGYFEHNSFVFEDKMMGLVVLESLFYALSTSCFEFSHLSCRDFVNLV